MLLIAMKSTDTLPVHRLLNETLRIPAHRLMFSLQGHWAQWQKSPWVPVSRCRCQAGLWGLCDDLPRPYFGLSSGDPSGSGECAFKRHRLQKGVEKETGLELRCKKHQENVSLSWASTVFWWTSGYPGLWWMSEKSLPKYFYMIYLFQDDYC